MRVMANMLSGHAAAYRAIHEIQREARVGYAHHHRPMVPKLSWSPLDGLMRRLAARYPAYGWDRNCGYATLEHISVVDSIGSTPHHRTSFRNRQQLELLFEEELVDTSIAVERMDDISTTQLQA